MAVCLKHSHATHTHKHTYTHTQTHHTHTHTHTHPTPHTHTHAHTHTHTHHTHVQIGVTIKGVTFSDISGTQVSGKAGEFLCSDSVPCTDINLDNINITAGKGTSDDSFVCWKAYGTATEVHPESCLKIKP